MRGELHFDAVVIGAGTAGMTTATRLAQRGARVCVVARGVGSTHLATGTIDVLGYAPERVQQPRAAIEQLIAARPDHPYALAGVQATEDAVAWLSECAAAGPLPEYRYVGDLEQNYLLPTAVGALRPSALIPETMARGDATAADSIAPVCVVGTPVLRDFHPALCAANLAKAGIQARALRLDLAASRIDENALGLARQFDDPAFRAGFCAELAPRLRSDERVGLPAMLGLADPHGAWSDLEHRLGRPVFEIPTLPPSVPGMRLYEILRSALRRAGGRLVLGCEVTGSERDGARLTAVRAHASGGELRYAADWFVLATGGFASGAIELDSHWVTRERLLDLPLAGLPEAGTPRFVERYLDEQPIARVGIAVDSELRAQGTDNVLVAGAALPGAAPWREGSGEGIALASAFAAAELALSTRRGTARTAA